MSKLAVRTELAKISALLAVPQADLDYLESLDVEALREFRELATEMLDETDRQKLAKSARLVARFPARLAARLAVRFVPPRVAARVGELVAVRKALKLASRLPAWYLAEMVRNTMPRRVSHILGALSVDICIPVANYLSERRDFVTLGRVVSYVDPRVVQVTIAELSDETVVNTVYLVEDEGALDRLIALVPDERLSALMEVVREQELWTEIVSLLAILGREQHGRVVNSLIRQDDEWRAAFLKAVDKHDAWDTMLAMYRVLDPEGQVYFAALVARRPTEVLEQYVYAAVKGSLWGDLSGLILAMPRESGSALLEICRRIGAETGNLGLQEIVHQLDEVMNRADAQDANSAAS